MTEEKPRFSNEELHLILNTLGQKSFNSEHKETIGKCLAKKKAAGIPINAQAIAICISENKPKTSKNESFRPVPKNTKVISLNSERKS